MQQLNTAFQVTEPWEWDIPYFLIVGPNRRKVNLHKGKQKACSGAEAKPYKVRKEARFVFLEANEGKNLNDPHNIRNTYEPDYDDEVDPGGETGVEIGGCVPFVYHTEKTCDGDKENMESKKLDKSSKVHMSLASTGDWMTYSCEAAPLESGSNKWATTPWSARWRRCRRVLNKVWESMNIGFFERRAFGVVHTERPAF